MNRLEALKIVEEFIENPNLINHMLAVEAAMVWYARKLGEDVEKWSIVGLLHDFDWEIHPTAEEHPALGADILRDRGTPEDIIRAILGHGTNSTVPRDSQMAKALFACDEITGLITASVLVRPSKSIMDLSVSSVKKKWKNKSFAAGANREEITLATEEFGIELWEHVGNVIEAMKERADELNLAGNMQPSA